MNKTRRKLEYLLLKKAWNKEDRQWMLDYLEEDDLTLLQTIAKEQFDDDMNGVERLIDEKLSEKILNKIHHKINMKPGRPRLNRFIAVAATVLVLIAAAYIYRYSVGIGNRSVYYIEINTQPGHSRKLSLSDGTEVWLSPASKLRYPDQFSGDKREIQLSGEAFFKVAKDASKPFIVDAGGLRTHILGTSFNIEAYKDRNYASVTVATGKVAVNKTESNKGLQEILLPNQQIIFNRNDKKMRKRGFPDADKLLYERRQGHLKYRGALLSNVIKDLQVQYGEKIKISQNMNKCTYYGEINVNDPLDVSLKLICLTLNAELKKEGNTYVIIGGDC